jgi:hypothetical protein
MATTTLTGLFPTYAQAQAAVRDLETEGVYADNISIVANNADNAHDATDRVADEATGASAGAGLGAVGGGAVGLLTGLGIMAIPGVGPVVAAGWLASTALGALAGGAAGAAVGGLASALSDAGVSEADAHVYSEGVRRGGALVVVKTDDTRADIVQSVLDRNRRQDVAAVRSTYERTGWKTFDPDSGPWTSDQIRDERNRYL